MNYYKNDSLKTEIIIYRNKLGVFITETRFNKVLLKLQENNTLKKIISEQKEIIQKDSVTKYNYEVYTNKIKNELTSEIKMNVELNNKNSEKEQENIKLNNKKITIKELHSILSFGIIGLIILTIVLL